MKQMKKNKAIRIITNCAKEYNEYLENKNLLFVFGNNHKQEAFEAVFEPRHFLHLTGIEANGRFINRSSDFYDICLKGQLSPSAFELAKNGTTDMKLSVLPQLMKIHKTAKMIGEYDCAKSFLMTEKIAGNVTACLGFVRDGNYYVPNTTLKEDIRNVKVKPQLRVIAILRKDIKSNYYTELCYTAKNIEKIKINIPNSILEKIDFDETVFSLNTTNDYTMCFMEKIKSAKIIDVAKQIAVWDDKLSITDQIKKAQSNQIKGQAQDKAKNKNLNY